MRRANLQGAFLVGADLQCLTKHDPFFGIQGERCARLGGANLIGARIEGANLTGAWVGQADFSRSRMEGAILTNVLAKKAIFRDARMRGVDLLGAYLVGSDFLRTDLRDANLNGADMEGASPIGANLRRANLSSTNITGAVFNQANLTGANCSDTDFDGVLLRDANLSCQQETLSQKQLQLAVGDEKTLLRHGLYVWSCLDRNDKSIAKILEYIDQSIENYPKYLTGSRGSRSLFRRGLFCDQSRTRSRVFYSRKAQ